MLYCARQCIALVGDHKKLDFLENLRNFAPLLNLIATHNAKLKQHLDMLKLKNTTHLSPEMQNERLIGLAREFTIQDCSSSQRCTNLHHYGQ